MLPVYPFHKAKIIKATRSGKITKSSGKEVKKINVFQAEAAQLAQQKIFITFAPTAYSICMCASVYLVGDCLPSR